MGLGNYKLNLGFIERAADLSTGVGAEERMLSFLTGLKEDYSILAREQVKITHQVEDGEKPKYEEVTNASQFLELAVTGEKLCLEGKALLFFAGSYQLSEVGVFENWDRNRDGTCGSCTGKRGSDVEQSQGGDGCSDSDIDSCKDYQAQLRNPAGETARPLSDLIAEVVRS